MATKPPKRLFRVTLDWLNDDEGDYCTLLWADDDESAILGTAKEMANNDETERTRKERKEFIDELVANAGPYAAEDVANGLSSVLIELLAGPRHKLSKKAEATYNEVVRLLTAQRVLS
jgi:hypothetical protein